MEKQIELSTLPVVLSSLLTKNGEFKLLASSFVMCITFTLKYSFVNCTPH